MNLALKRLSRFNFLIVLTGALLVGPLAGLIGRPVRKLIQSS
jgi:hypothetical protein